MSTVQTSLRSAGWVSLWSFAQLLVQFAFQVALAKYFGAAAEMDAYVAAIAVPTVLSSIFVGSLGYVLIPVYTEQLATAASDRAWATANSVLTVLGIVTFALAGLLFLFAAPVIAILYSGLSEQQSAQTASLLVILAWLVVTNGLITYSQAIHHCHKSFIVPAIAPVAGTGVTLAITILFHNEYGIEAIATAVLAGSIVTTLIQVPLPLSHYRPLIRIDEKSQYCFRLMLPLVCGAAYYRLDPLIDRHLASGLDTGSLAHLGYASRLVTATLMVTTTGLSVVAFPNFALHQAAGQLRELCAEVAHAIRCLCVITVPIVVAVLIYSQPLIHDLFERGEFTAADTRVVALLLVIYLGMIVAAAFGEITAKVFYSLSETRTPTIIGCVVFTIGVALKFSLLPIAGIIGIAIATSLYYALGTLTHAFVLWRKLGRRWFSGVGGALVRALTAAVIAAVAAFPITKIELPMGTFIAGALGGGVYFAALVWQRDEIAVRLLQYLQSRRSRQ